MPWTSYSGRQRRARHSQLHLYSGIFVLLAAGSTLLLLGVPDEKHLSVYSNAANYSLPVTERNGSDYVGLLELFEPLGTVTSKTGGGGHWKFRYYEVESEFTAGKTRVKVRGKEFDLPANFLLENGRGLVPLASLETLLPRILGGPVTFHSSALRLFIGNVAVHFTAQMSKTDSTKLVMDFTSPVNPAISTEPGKIRMVFAHEPLVAPGTQSLTFDSKTIPSASYEERNGAAEIVIASSVPLLATFANDGRTIVLGPPPATAAQTPQPNQPAPQASAPPQMLASTGPAAIRSRQIVIDPSHGGEERGAVLSDQLVEKDITLAFARRLRLELATRGITALLLRDADNTLSLDQRAATTNAIHPALYICLHAASQGNGVRLYAPLLSGPGENRGPFLDWNSAQAGFLPNSQVVQAALAAELQNRRVPVRSLTAALRPLNNVSAAALAVEIAPPGDDASQLDSPSYQQLIAGALAAGITAARERIEAGQ